LEAGRKCHELIFIVNGKVDIIVEDKFGEKSVLETLYQGSNIGQYAVLSKLPLFFSA